MTNEEAKEFLIKISLELGTTGIEHFSCKDGERMREAISELEQPSETREQQMIEGFAQFMRSFLNNPNLQNPMRDATVEEQMSVDRYIESISHDTGNRFFNFDAPMVKVEDCINREDAIKCVKSLYAVGFCKEDLLNVLKGLPPVTPARIRGKWILHTETVGDDFNGYDDIEFFECSHCQKKQEYKFLFCPNCGAEMEVDTK